MDAPATYDSDTYLWSQHQAALLRGLIGSGLALPNELDLENVAEEVESVGRSELSSVQSHLEGMLRHLVKIVSAPESTARRGWLEEVEEHQAQAIRRYTPGMRQNLELGTVWVQAVRRARTSLELHEEPVAPMPEVLPFALDDLLDARIAPKAFVDLLAAALDPPPA